MKATVSITVCTEPRKTWTEEIDREAINDRHQAISKEHPEHHVNFVYDNGQSFICGMIWNMWRDELLMENGMLGREEYEERWYPDCIKPSTLRRIIGDEILEPQDPEEGHYQYLEDSDQLKSFDLK